MSVNDVPPVRLAEGVWLGSGCGLAIIAGPCVIEGEAFCVDLAGALSELCAARGLSFVFKASFDKANRTAVSSPRGPGLHEGLRCLEAVRAHLGVPVLTDVHELGQVRQAAAVVQVLQVPAFLCRQTDLLLGVGASGCGVNIKKGQFLAPEDMRFAVEKARAGGATAVTVTERGSSFGHGDLVVDMRGVQVMSSEGTPVIFDATHSSQRPGAGGHTSGDRRYVATLSRAAIAAGAHGIFAEVHPDPERALSDRATQLPLRRFAELLDQLLPVAAAMGMPVATR